MCRNACKAGLQPSDPIVGRWRVAIAGTWQESLLPSGEKWHFACSTSKREDGAEHSARIPARSIDSRNSDLAKVGKYKEGPEIFGPFSLVIKALAW